jgi:hypothetical protein
MGKHYMESAWELEIKDRLKASTPGPWRIEERIDQHHDKRLDIRQPSGASEYGICEIFGDPDGEDGHVRADAELIAHAQSDLEMLLKMVADLRTELAATPER